MLKQLTVLELVPQIPKLRPACALVSRSLLTETDEPFIDINQSPRDTSELGNTHLSHLTHLEVTQLAGDA